MVVISPMEILTIKTGCVERPGTVIRRIIELMLPALDGLLFTRETEQIREKSRSEAYVTRLGHVKRPAAAEQAEQNLLLLIL